MNKDVTVVFVSYYSRVKILKYLKQFHNKFKVIIIDNSKDLLLKKIVKKYKNVSIEFNKKNLGFGASSNIGLKKIKTKYGIQLDLDTSFSNKSIMRLIKIANEVNNFFILGPRIKNFKYLERDYENKISKNLYSMNFIDGCCMLFNMKKFKHGYFDEKIFLYFEEYDLFKRYIKRNEKIIMAKNVTITHEGRSSSSKKYNDEIEINRNWHYMWSKFYFYKKHNNYLYAFLKIIKNLFSSIFKIFFYSLLKNKLKKKIYIARFSGIINSMINNKSWYRPNK